MTASRRCIMAAMLGVLLISIAGLLLQTGWYIPVYNQNHIFGSHKFTLSNSTYILTTRVSAVSGPTSRISTATTQLPQSSPPKCHTLHTGYPDAIPAIIHWTSKDGRIPGKLVPLVQTWRRLVNSTTVNWRFMHWDDKQLRQLISTYYPRVASSYAKLINGLERSDIGRLVVLHHVGGVYVDTDVELLKDLAPLLGPPAGLKAPLVGNGSRGHGRLPGWSAILAQEPLEHAEFLFNMERLVTNAVMLSRANHSFLSYVLNTWPGWFDSKWAGKTRKFNDAVLITGPIMLNNLYESYLKLAPSERPPDWNGLLLSDSGVFQPIWDSVWAPGIVKKTCLNPGDKPLNNLKRSICARLAKTNFATWPIPASSFTVHRYSHMSYTDSINVQGGSHIAKLLPILTCTL